MNALKLTSGYAAGHAGQATPILSVRQLQAKKSGPIVTEMSHYAKRKGGGKDAAKTEAETHPSCSMKERGTKIVLTMRSLISFFFFKGGAFLQGGERRVTQAHHKLQKYQ